MTVTHPLDMLTGDEIKRAVEDPARVGPGARSALFAHIVLHEPHKDDARALEAGRSRSSGRCAWSSCPVRRWTCTRSSCR